MEKRERSAEVRLFYGTWKMNSCDAYVGAANLR